MKPYFSSCLSVLLATLAMTVCAQSKIQYWIDHDSNNINERQISGNTFSTVIDTRGLSEGLHRLTYRAVDDSGTWSAQRTSFFYISPAPSKSTNALRLEYWFDGNDHQKRKAILSDGKTSQLIDLSGLSAGLHRLTYRAVDDCGIWSAQRTSLILISDDTPSSRYVTEVQHWIDNDIDNRISEPVAHSGSQVLYVRDIKVDTISARTSEANLRVGLNSDSVMSLYDLRYLHTRFRDDRGKWTALLTDSFVVAYGNVKVDVTGLLTNPDANNLLDGWNSTRYVNTTAGQHYGGPSLRYFTLGTDSPSGWTCSMSQTIDKLPSGNYMVSVAARGQSDIAATLCVGDERAEIVTSGTEGGEIWALSDAGSAEKSVNGGKGFGWNETHLAVTTNGGPLTICVEGIAHENERRLDVTGFRLTKLIDNDLEIVFDPSADMSLYKGSKLTVRHENSSATQTVGTHRSYVFSGLSLTAPYDIDLRNEHNQLLWHRDGFVMNDNDPTVSIHNIKPMREVTLSVVDPYGSDISDRVNAEWRDSDGNLLATGLKASRMADGSTIGYTLSLGDSLGIVYVEPPLQLFEVSETTSSIEHRLTLIDSLTLSAKVTRNGHQAGKSRLHIAQLINGKYPLVTKASTDADGKLSIALPNDSCTVRISTPGCYNRIVTLPHPADMGTIDMQRITATGISPQIGLVERSEGPEPSQPTTWYSGLDNLSFTATVGSRSDEQVPVLVQNDMLYIEDAQVGDEIEIKLTDISGAYIGSSARLVYEPDSVMTASFRLTALGSLRIKVAGSDNASTDYLLFDEAGRFVRSTNVNGERAGMIENIVAGEYTIVAMGRSSLLGMFSDLDALEASGLRKDTDYVSARVTITDALQTSLDLPFLSRLNDKAFYFTTENAALTVNTTEPIPGSYVTYTARLEFKEQYRQSVDNLSLIVDIPDGMDYIHNSVIVGSEPVLADLEGNRLIIPLTRENYLQRIRFCLVPSEAGTTYTNASVRFSSDGEVTQPLGRIAVYTKELELNVPKVTNRPSIIVRGTATPGSEVKIYDNDLMIGTAQAMHDGLWNSSCTLENTYNLSRHSIQALVTTPSGLRLATPVSTVTYNIDVNHVKTVTMINTKLTGEARTVFDFVNPSERPKSYSYLPKYPDFTFIIDFADNSPENVDDVQVNVETTAGTVETLTATYDSISNRWVATGSFDAFKLPVNVNISYYPWGEPRLIDSDEISDIELRLTAYTKGFSNFERDLDRALNEIDLLIEPDPTINAEIVRQKYLDLLPESDNADQNQLHPDLSEILERIKSEQNTDNIVTLADDFCAKFESIYHFAMPSIDSYKNLGFGKDEFVISSNDFKCSFGSDEQKAKCANGDEVLDCTHGQKQYISLVCNHLTLKNPQTNFVIEFEILNDKLQVPDSGAPINHDEITRVLDSYSDVLNLSINANNELVKALLSAMCDNTELSQSLNISTKGLQIDLPFIMIKIGKKLRKGIESANLTNYFKENYPSLIKLRPWGNVGWDAGEGIAYNNYLFGLLPRYSHCLSSDEYWDLIHDIEKRCNESRDKRMSRQVKNAMINTLSKRLFHDEKIYEITQGDAIEHGVGLIAANFITNTAIDMLLEKKVNSDYKELNDKYGKLCKDNLPDPKDILKRIEDSNNPNAVGLVDPSGYVYEAVTSNRLAGVTATLFEQAVSNKPWNANLYHQVNPQTTDQSGLYAWDVPVGNWQVRFAKPGYESVSTSWLPVPPPQLDINVPMRHAVKPVVKEGKGYPTGVTLTFDKYMIPSTISTDNVTVSRNGADLIDGHIEPLNLEKDPYTGKSFASKFQFATDSQLAVGEEVTVRVSKGVMSYAEMPLRADTTLRLRIEPEIDALRVPAVINVAPGSMSVLDIQAEPAAASAERYVKITDGSMFYCIEQERVRLNENGHATVNVRGDLIGSAPLFIGVEGTDLVAETKVNVSYAETEVKKPRASVASGSTVAPGTPVVLYSPTEGASIYYTTDGTCPCEDSSRQLYTGPISIDRDIVIKAQAEKEGLAPSDVAMFEYFIDNSLSIREICESDNRVLTRNGAVVLMGMNGDNCRIYDSKGIVVWHGNDLQGETTVKLPVNQVYLIGLTDNAGRMTVTKVLL